jgi:hypothetical protein
MNSYHYAVVVGISGYPAIGNLASPVDDANEFRKWLIHGGEVPEANIKPVLTSEAANDVTIARPIKSDVDRALLTVNEEATNAIGGDLENWQRSRLYIYVAGHGIMPRGGETALLCADAQDGLYEHLELSAYLKWYAFNAVFQEVVVFADCCRNWYGNVDASPAPFMGKSRPQGRVFYLTGWACGPGDPAYEQTEVQIPPDRRRGYFTRALIDGLQGSAAVDRKFESITSATLAAYVSRAVGVATAHLPVPQQVTMPLDLATPMRFGIRLSTPTYRVTMLFPPTWNDAVQLLHPDGSRETWDKAPAAWTLQLRAGMYALVLPNTLDHPTEFANGGLFMVTGDTDVNLSQW